MGTDLVVQASDAAFQGGKNGMQREILHKSSNVLQIALGQEMAQSLRKQRINHDLTVHRSWHSFRHIEKAVLLLSVQCYKWGNSQHC